MGMTIVWMFALLVAAGPVMGQEAVVSLIRDATDASAGGVSCYRINTPNAVYYLEKSGAGLSSLVDPDGNDWLSFHPQAGSGARGEYRGFPNAIHQQDGNYFHARNEATDPSTVTVLAETPTRVSLLAESGNGAWQARWDFFSDHCRFTMLRMPEGYQYWILYEGTPGGLCDADDRWMTSASEDWYPLTQRHEGDIPAPEWMVFADPPQKRGLFVLHHADDDHPDTYYLMESAMTVFGFGREGLGKFLETVPRSFSIGLMEASSPEGVRAGMRTMMQSIHTDGPLK